MHNHNNFLIFRGVFWHTIDQLPLFIHYPAEYGDMNHYGPLFSLVIAPFAVVPEWLGLIMWDVALALFLYVAIRNLAPQPSTLTPHPSTLNLQPSKFSPSGSVPTSCSQDSSCSSLM